MNKTLFSLFLICALSFTAKSQTLNCDSFTAIVPCDSVYSAFSELNSFYASGSDSGIIFSSTFATLYLSIRYQNYGLGPSTWGSILVCCTPPNVTFEDTLTSCDTVALMGLNIQYALPPPPRGSCYPA